jgi:hypothetical protein
VAAVCSLRHGFRGKGAQGLGHREVEGQARPGGRGVPEGLGAQVVLRGGPGGRQALGTEVGRKPAGPRSEARLLEQGLRCAEQPPGLFCLSTVCGQGRHPLQAAGDAQAVAGPLEPL